MFDNFRQEDTDLNEAVAAAFKYLKGKDPDSDEYKKTMNQLTKLYALKPPPMDIDPTKLLIALSNIFIGLAVIKYERTGVITTKVMSFLSKL